MRMKIWECFDILICEMGMTADTRHLSIEHLTHGYVFLYLYELSKYYCLVVLQYHINNNFTLNIMELKYIFSHIILKSSGLTL